MQVFLFTSVLLILYSDSSIAKENNDTGGRIINGNLASAGQVPWQVGVFHSVNGQNMFCGGSLISNEWVITAGHCVYGATISQVILGATKAYDQEKGKIAMKVRRALFHPFYNPRTLNNDVALIQLVNRVALSWRVSPIRLPGRNDFLGGGVNVFASGWGKLNDQMQAIQNDLYWVNLVSITNQECLRTFSQQIIKNYIVCCNGKQIKGTCSGDSGGPLWLYGNDGRPTLVGVTSFVDARGCTIGSPTGYSRTQSFLGFIRANTGLQV